MRRLPSACLLYWFFLIRRDNLLTEGELFMEGDSTRSMPAASSGYGWTSEYEFQSRID